MTDKKRDKHRYVRVVIDGQRCTMEPREAEALISSAPIEADAYPLQDVWLTRAEFEALPEFQGVVK